MNTLISLEEAVSLCRRYAYPVEDEHIKLDDACLRVAARDVVSDCNVPDFERSAVDGYAICQTDLLRVNSGELKLPLQVSTEVSAGSCEDTAVRPGETVRIMTGAVLPTGTAAVFKQEHVEQQGSMIFPGRKIRAGENIQQAGSDIAAGTQLLKKGQLLDSDRIERIASCGVGRVLVHRMPRIYIINTGNELVLPGIPLKRGQIYHSNRSLLAAKTITFGGKPVLADTGTKDVMSFIAEEIEMGAENCDMIIISGGTGSGSYDLVYDSLQEIGAEILFKGINIVPGRGAAAAVHRGKLIFNLTGNPGAGSMLFEVLIKPAVSDLRGIVNASGRWFEIRLHSPVKKILKQRSLRRAEMLFDDQGNVSARPLREINSINNQTPLILDLKPGQGRQGDIVRAMMI